MLTIYHNPRCQKSRQALALLEAAEVPFTVVEYLKDVPSPMVLRDALQVLGAEMLLRTNEPEYKEHFTGDAMTDEDVVALLQAYPKVLQRPLLTDGTRWVVGRPVEEIEKLLK